MQGSGAFVTVKFLLDFARAGLSMGLWWVQPFPRLGTRAGMGLELGSSLPCCSAARSEWRSHAAGDAVHGKGTSGKARCKAHGGGSTGQKRPRAANRKSRRNPNAGQAGECHHHRAPTRQLTAKSRQPVLQRLEHRNSWNGLNRPYRTLDKGRYAVLQLPYSGRWP